MSYVYQCEDTLEGIFTAIYRIYEDRHHAPETRICLEEENLLFSEYVTVETDVERAVKVMRTCKEKFGEQDYYGLCMALATTDMERLRQCIRLLLMAWRRSLIKGICLTI